MFIKHVSNEFYGEFSTHGTVFFSHFDGILRVREKGGPKQHLRIRVHVYRIYCMMMDDIKYTVPHAHWCCLKLSTFFPRVFFISSRD